MASNDASLKKRKAAARPAAPASHIDDDAPLPLSASKKSKRAAAGTASGANRYESEFVSVEVGLREFHKRMASSSGAPPAKRAATKKKSDKADTKDGSTESQRAKKPVTSRRKNSAQGDDDDESTATPTPTSAPPTRRAPAKTKAATPKTADTAVLTTPTKKRAVASPAARKRADGNRPTTGGNALAEARAAAMQQQQERVQQRVLGLQRAANTSAAPPHETQVVVKAEPSASPPQPPQNQIQQTPATLDTSDPGTLSANLDGDTALLSHGFIEDDVDEDFAFLQALEEVERKLQPTTISDLSRSPVAYDPVSAVAAQTTGVSADTQRSSDVPLQSLQELTKATVKEELAQTASAPAAVASTTMPPEMVAEYERLKRENEALRRSNDMLQAGQSTHVAVAPDTSPASDVSSKNVSTTPQSMSPGGEIGKSAFTISLIELPSPSTEQQAAQSHHEEVDTSAEIVGGGGDESGDEAMASVGDEDDEDMKSVYEDVEHGGGSDDEKDGENEVDEEEEVQEEEEEQEEEEDAHREDNGSLIESRVSTIDRGNYSQYRAKDDAEIDDEEDTMLPFKATKPRLHKSAPPVNTSQQRPPASRASEPMAPPSVDEGSETESDHELLVGHHRRGTAVSESSSSSSEESESEKADASAGGSNALEAALRAATGQAPVKEPTKGKSKHQIVAPKASPEKGDPVDVKREDVGDPSSSPVDEMPRANRNAKKRRAATPSTTTLSAKDKSTLMWPTLDDFYDFVLDLTPRRVLHSDPLHLQLVRAYEKAHARLPMHYPGITQYCDIQLESILEELLSSVRNAEEVSLHTSSRSRLWLSSISPCGANTSHSSTMKKATSATPWTSLNPNVIFMESGFSGTSAAGKSDFIVTFQDKRTGPTHRSALSDFVSGDVLAMRSPQWRDYDIYAFGIVLCSSVVAVGGAASSGASSNSDQLCVLIRAPSATEDDPEAASHFGSVMEMCLVNQGSAQWSWSLDQVHNLTTSAREFQAIKSVRFFKPETKEMLMSGIIPEIVKSEQTQIIEPRKKLTSGLCEELERKYNESQMHAILGAISDSSSISIIQGPPGTGKTKTILGVLSALLDGAALTASRQAQVKSRVRIGASLEQKKPSAAAAAQDKKSVAQDSIRVLVAAPSNAAVDELIVRLLSEGVYDARQRKSYRPRIVRVGRPESLQQQQRPSSSNATDRLQQQEFARKKKWRKYASEVEEILLENLVNKNKSAFPTAKQARQTIIQNAQIVFCTLSGAGSVAMCELQSQHFDALVIDEAAQAVEASLLIPFKFQPGRVVLVGDHRQLPATVISKRLIDLGYDRSLFQRLVENGSRVFMLTQQYRMHPEISWFPSTYFYNSKLIEAPQMKEWTARKYHREALFRPFLFYDVLAGQQSQVNGSKSLRNVNEIECVVHLLTQLVVKQFPELEWRRRIGIIAPYKQQIYELRNELQRWEKQHDKRLEIEVNTVDGFQGREKEVIIYSCVRTSRAGHGRSSSRPNGKTIEAFWADERRMNVAITRAKSSLWIIGNSTLLQQSEAWRALITHAKDSRRYILDEELMGVQQQSTGSHSRSHSREQTRDRNRDRSRHRDRGDRRSRARSHSNDQHQ